MTTPDPTKLADEEDAAVNDDLIKHLTERFLAWKLPENFRPDAGISFNAVANEGSEYEYRHEPTGTNLFDYTQAKAMVEHMLDGAPLRRPSATPAAVNPDVERMCPSCRVRGGLRCDECYQREAAALTPRPDTAQDSAERQDFSRLTLQHNLEKIIREGRDAHPDTLLRRIMAAIPVGAYPAEDSAEREAGIDWFKGEVDCDGNELITLPRQDLALLCLAARTSGGVAGRDDGLCAALDRVERHFPPALASQDAPSADAGEPCVVCGNPNRSHFDHGAPFLPSYHEFQPTAAVEPEESEDAPSVETDLTPDYVAEKGHRLTVDGYNCERCNTPAIDLYEDGVYGPVRDCIRNAPSAPPSDDVEREAYRIVAADVFGDPDGHVFVFGEAEALWADYAAKGIRRGLELAAALSRPSAVDAAAEELAVSHAQGAGAERAQIVAWLRTAEFNTNTNYGAVLANRIERGEHLTAAGLLEEGEG